MQNAFSVASVDIFIQLNLIQYGDVLTCTLAATDETKRPRHVQTWRVSLSIGMSHVTILCTIQVWRFFAMCQGIMNNPVCFQHSALFYPLREVADGFGRVYR
jgi:hypothetical protein